jgi:hypothetical protein
MCLLMQSCVKRCTHLRPEIEYALRQINFGRVRNLTLPAPYTQITINSISFPNKTYKIQKSIFSAVKGPMKHLNSLHHSIKFTNNVDSV